MVPTMLIVITGPGWPMALVKPRMAMKHR